MNVFYILLIIVFTVFATIICYNKYIEKQNTQQVNHPSHYQKNGKECIEVMEEQFGPKAVYYFCILNDFKYKWRAGFKYGNSYKQDIAKAKWYDEYAKKIYAKYPKEFNIERYN